MTKHSTKQDLNVAADQVWSLIGHFNALPDWRPAVEKSELKNAGQVRKLALVGGGTIVEKLEKVDAKTRTYSYAIEDSPLPVKHYRAELTVHDDKEDCTVEWSSEFDAACVPENDAMKAIQDVYQAGFDNLKKMFGG
ncbi:MAG: SRPBCC family protein [Rhodospirillaceae bacterium]